MVVAQRFGRNIFQHIVALGILAHGGKHQRVARAVIGLIRAGHTPVPAFMLGHVYIKGLFGDGIGRLAPKGRQRLIIIHDRARLLAQMTIQLFTCHTP